MRIARACADSGIGSVAVYTDPDRDSLHVRVADEAYALGGSTPGDSYLLQDKLIEVAHQAGADAVQRSQIREVRGGRDEHDVARIEQHLGHQRNELL